MKRFNRIRSSRLLLPLLLVLGAKADPDPYTAPYATPAYAAPTLYLYPTHSAPAPSPFYPTYAPSYFPVPVPYGYGNCECQNPSQNPSPGQSSCTCAIPVLRPCTSDDYSNMPTQGGTSCQCNLDAHPQGCTPKDCEPGGAFLTDYVCFCKASLGSSGQSMNCITIPPSPSCGSSSGHGSNPVGGAPAPGEPARAQSTHGGAKSSTSILGTASLLRVLNTGSSVTPASSGSLLGVLGLRKKRSPTPEVEVDLFEGPNTQSSHTHLINTVKGGLMHADSVSQSDDQNEQVEHHLAISNEVEESRPILGVNVG